MYIHERCVDDDSNSTLSYLEADVSTKSLPATKTTIYYILHKHFPTARYLETTTDEMNQHTCIIHIVLSRVLIVLACASMKTTGYTASMMMFLHTSPRLFLVEINKQNKTCCHQF